MYLPPWGKSFSNGLCIIPSSGAGIQAEKGAGGRGDETGCRVSGVGGRKKTKKKKIIRCWLLVARSLLRSDGKRG
jgi:hypothetical protein